MTSPIETSVAKAIDQALPVWDYICMFNPLLYLAHQTLDKVMQ